MDAKPKHSSELLIFLFTLYLASACGGSTQLPKGPPPEYEEEPGMSQADAAPPTAPVADAGAAG